MTSVIINSVDRALDILNYLYEQGKEVSITQISKDLDIYKSTVYRTLATLESKDFVEKNPETEKYGLGMKLFVIGHSIGEKIGLQKVIQPYAKQLHDEFKEAVNVSVLEHSDGGPYHSVMIYKEENKQILGFNSDLGSRNECYCAGVGKCLMAFKDQIDLSVYEKFPMTKYTERTITTIEGLEKELEMVRRQGYAVDDEERELGLTCIAVPIMNGSTKQAVAAISLSGPTTRIKDSTYETKIKRLKEIGREISEKLK